MKPSMPLPEDMELRPCHKLILIITRNTNQTKLLSVPAMLTQKHNRSQCSKIEILQKSSQERELLRSTSISRTKLTCMVQDNLLLIIALAMSWIPLSGIVPAGPLRKTLTPIKIELNTESNSISQNHSTIESLDRALEKSVTRTWLMSQETWELQASVERISTTRDSRKLEEDARMDSPSTSTTSRNEYTRIEVSTFEVYEIHRARKEWDSFIGGSSWRVGQPVWLRSDQCNN